MELIKMCGSKHLILVNITTQPVKVEYVVITKSKSIYLAIKVIVCRFYRYNRELVLIPKVI